MGEDTVTYECERNFARDFVIQKGDGPPPIIRVAADGLLKAASTEIKDEDEEDIGLPVGGDTEPKREGRRLFRDARQVKPGNNIYIRVKDADLDKSPVADEAVVTVTASSGDLVQVACKETELHSGKFDGTMLTGVRPADALASDWSEGHEPRYAIDGSLARERCWIGAMDGKTPKWLTVDLKELCTVDKMTWHLGLGAKDRAPIRYLVESSADGEQWETITTVPKAWYYHQKLEYKQLRVRYLPNMMGDPKNLDEVMMMCEMSPRIYGERNVAWINDEEGNPFGPDEYFIAVYWGKFYCPETGEYEFATDSDDASFLLVDGTLICEFPGNHAHANNWTHKGGIHLEKGIHEITYYFQEWEIIQVARAAWKLPSATSFEVIPKENFDPQVYPQIIEKPKKEEDEKPVVIEPLEDAVGTTISWSPRKLRCLRMLIHEYQGDAPAVAHFAVYSGKKQIVPTGIDVHKLATNKILEVSPGDEIVVAYHDEVNLDMEAKILRETLQVTFYDAHIRAMKREWVEDERGNRRETERLTRRINAGEKFFVEIEDFDEDRTDGIDKVAFTLETKSGKALKLYASETEPYSGVFTKDITTSLGAGRGVLALSDGDEITLKYEDRENTDPGHRVERTYLVFENVPTNGLVRIVPSLEKKGEEEKAPAEGGVKLVSVEEPLVIEVIDPDQALDSGDTVEIELVTTDGDTAKVICEVPGSTTTTGGGEEVGEALRKGLFEGEIKLVLGDHKSPDTIVEAVTFDNVALSTRRTGDEASITVLNVSGKDVITASYEDVLTVKDPAKTARTDKARIFSDGTIGIFDSQYEKPIEFMHVGEKLYVMVEDSDADVSEARDGVGVAIVTSRGDRLDVTLTETLSHTGVFSAGIPTYHAPKPDPANDKLELDFGVSIAVTYKDVNNTESALPAEREAKVAVVVGCDGQIVAFSKLYPDEDLAVSSEFRLGECYYNLGKEHIGLNQKKAGLKELSEGEKILTEVVIRYPNAKSIDEAAYLLAKISQEQKKYDDAIRVYRRITREFSESSVAPEAQYQMGICYEKKGEFDKACEEYVRLAYMFPDSTLLADGMIRIGLYFFEEKVYMTAAGVFERFIEKFPLHKAVEKVAFKMGLCYILGEKFAEGGELFQSFVEKFPDSGLRPAALYWAGDSYLKARDALKAYQMFKRVIWDFPDTKWAKYARGRLTSPIFDRIAEME